MIEGMKVDGSILMLFSTSFSLIYPINPKALWEGGRMLCSFLQRRVRHVFPAKVQRLYNCGALFQGNYTARLEVRVGEEECKSIFQVDISQKQKKAAQTIKRIAVMILGGKKGPVPCLRVQQHNINVTQRSLT